MSFWRRKKREEELGEEVRSHLEMAARERLERGETEKEAGRAALREFGNVGLVKEVTRDVWGWKWLRDAADDARYGLRMLLKNPGFAAVAISSLALGIGATTAVFSVVYGVLVNPYPYANSDRMVHLVVHDNAGNRRFVNLNGPQLRELRQATSVESVAAMDEWDLTTTEGDLPENVQAVYLTSNAFIHFGVPALLGRGFLPSDAPEGQDPENVAVLGYQFWQRHYNGDPDIVGKKIQLVHKSYEVVGVVRPRFTWGDGEVYLPLKLTADPVRTFFPMIRLKPGVTRAATNAEFQSLLEQFAKQTPNHFPEHFHVTLEGLNDHFVADIGGTLYLLLAAVALLLLIGCGNVSILLLARATGRQHELAVRSAVGAARSRILRQLLTESLLLSISGAALGVALAHSLVKLIVNWLPEFSFPHEAAISINLPVLCFSVGLALLTGIVFGISPALQSARPDVARVMQANTRKMTAGVHGRRTHSILIAGQMALTLLLLAAAGVAMRGFMRLMHVNLGYDPQNVMSVGIPVHDNTYTTWESRRAYFDQLLRKVSTTPEVVSAGLSTNATPPNNGWEQRFEISGKPAAEQQRARINFVSPEYFSVLRIPLLQGRIWEESETEHGSKLALINQTLARQYFPNGGAVGSEIRVPELKGEPPFQLAVAGSDSWFQVIGIVGDARDDGLRNPIKPSVFVPYTVMLGVWTQILVRTRVPPLTVLRAVREQIHAVDPDQQSFRDVRDLDGWIKLQPEWAEGHLVATLFAGFAILALTLAAIGLYSVISYTVAQRTGEFGIRMALGAMRKDVLLMVFRSAAMSIGGGVLAGIILTITLHRVLARWIQGGSLDALVLAGVILLLLATSGLSCLIPARRASSLDPVVALRYE
ncbi:MAG TPA: ABC transporter permease [Candidatus Udaeobacter sp.]|nr:ABC transporter permease [Candidatus Udaeobacter sp.]